MADQANLNPPPPYDVAAAGLRVVLSPGGTLQKQDALTVTVKGSISTVLALVRGKLLPGKPVTDDEVNTFIDLIYGDGWQPGGFIKTPPVVSTTASGETRGCVIGTLAQSLSETPAKLGKSRARSQADRQAFKRTAKRSTDVDRRIGARVILLVEHKQHGVITFTFRDRGCKIMTGDAKITYAYGMDKKRAYFHSMRKNDEFFGKTCHAFNMEQALYICRNRLTYWSCPGIHVGTPPPQEDLNLAFADLYLCRYSNHIIGAPAESVADLKATPARKLLR